jgi:hypothetical protein
VLFLPGAFRKLQLLKESHQGIGRAITLDLGVEFLNLSQNPVLQSQDCLVLPQIVASSSSQSPEVGKCRFRKTEKLCRVHQRPACPTAQQLRRPAPRRIWELYIVPNMPIRLPLKVVDRRSRHSCHAPGCAHAPSYSPAYVGAAARTAIPNTLSNETIGQNRCLGRQPDRHGSFHRR